MTTRRSFLLQTVTAGTAVLCLPAWANALDGEADAAASADAGWQRLAAQRVAQANARDLDALMSAYARNAELLVNGLRIPDAERRPTLEALGFGARGAALADARLTTDEAFVTEDEILHRGRLTGKHVDTLLGFPPTGRNVTIHYSAFRRFTREQQLASERLVLNLGVLVPNWTLLDA